MSKSADAFRTISEVADVLDVQKHVLRFWEVKFPQIRPMKRGGGRRYYRPEDMVLLRGIQHLLHAEGYTIKGVQKILREQGVEQVKVHGLAATAIAEGGGKTTAKPNAASVKEQAPSAASAGRVRALPKTAKPDRAAKSASSSPYRAAMEAALAELQLVRDMLANAFPADKSAPAAANASAAQGRTAKSGRTAR